jgi:hypothetical protein
MGWRGGEDRRGIADNRSVAKLINGVLARGLSGGAGSAVFVQGPFGATYVRERPFARPGSSAAQRGWRDLMRRAGAMWRTLDADEVEAWWLYAEVLRGYDADSPPANASGLFTALAVKVWQFDPMAEPLRVPPPTAFTGDGIEVAVSAVGGATPGVQFVASGPNAGGIATELLLQPLPSLTARPKRGKDRHRGFASFAPGSLEAFVPAQPGAYAASIRFLRVSTGQTSLLVRLGAVVV